MARIFFLLRYGYAFGMIIFWSKKYWTRIIFFSYLGQGQGQRPINKVLQRERYISVQF